MTTTFLTPTTELEAVNILLAAAGETPVSSLEGQQIVEATTALSTLREVSREIQMAGWYFNREEEYPLARDTEGEIRLPSNALQVSVDPYLYPDLKVVQRGVRLYDKASHSFKFAYDVNATIVFLLAFTDIPEAACRYVTIRAARIFQDRQQGDGTIHDFTERDEYGALSTLKALEDETGHYNMLSGSNSVSRVLRR